MTARYACDAVGLPTFPGVVRPPDLYAYLVAARRIEVLEAGYYFVRAVKCGSTAAPVLVIGLRRFRRQFA